MNKEKIERKPTITFYFQVHQPFRIRSYGVFDIGTHTTYFNEKKNKEILLRVSRKCYLPANRLMLNLLKAHKDFKISYSITGTIIEQLETYSPETLDSFKKLLRHERVEVLAETYYHSLSFLFSKREFVEQIEMHRNLMKELFHKRPKVFRNTELIYSDELAPLVEEMGFKAILVEGADHILGWRSPNYVYKARGANVLLLLKNYRLSDDIAFRFSTPYWEEFPLTSEKYAAWLNACNGDTINLFMDYETFGEHQWAETGIFHFMEKLPGEVKKYGISFTNPSDLLNIPPKDELSYPYPVSWADTERDLSAWLGNPLQENAIRELYKFERYVKSLKDPNLLHLWRKLQTSDNFYYMCTKWFNDGDVHKYFNPHDTPYDAFISYMNILNDLAILIGKKLSQKKSKKQIKTQSLKEKNTINFQHTARALEAPQTSKIFISEQPVNIIPKIMKTYPPDH